MLETVAEERGIEVADEEVEELIRAEATAAEDDPDEAIRPCASAVASSGCAAISG